MREAFAVQKLLTFFQQKVLAYLRYNVWNFNETLTSDNRAQVLLNVYISIMTLGVFVPVSSLLNLNKNKSFSAAVWP